MADRQSFYLGSKAIIERDGAVLILRDTVRQKWELPGGRVDEGESLELACARELGEEMKGVRLTLFGTPVLVAIGDFTVENDHKLCLVFSRVQAELPDEFTLSHEHDDKAWVRAEELDNYDLYSTDKEAITRYLQG